MRNFKFPPSDAHAPSFLVFIQFPNDIGLAIMEECSPFGLVQLSLTSRGLRSFINAHQHLWTNARLNIARGTCPRLPAPPVVESSGNYSQSAYASYLFSGGRCTICSEWTDSQPVNFVFRFRACSSKCKAKIVFSSMHVPKEHDNLHWGKWLPREIYVQENGETTHLYSIRAKKDAELERQQAIALDAGNSQLDPSVFPRRTVKELNEECRRRERSRPALLKNAFELETWHELYIAERELIFHKNLETLKGFALTENKKIQGVLRCPTIAPLFRAFNRDLTLITHTVWMQHRKRALVELKVLAEGVFPPGMVARRNVKIRCAHCPRLLRVWAMASHLADKHQDTDIDAMPATTPCPDCPGSKRMFTNRGLMDHRLNKHCT